MAKNSMSVLSYQDVVLYPEDIATSKNGEWLNDNIVAFVLEWLQHDHPTLSHRAQEQAYLPPSIIQMMSALEIDALVAILSDLELQTKHNVFLCISDSDSFDTSLSGSHWTLLHWKARSGTLELHDSAHFNWSAKHHLLADKLQALVQQTIPEQKRTTVECERQRNGYDCGIHMLSNLEATALRDEEARCISDRASIQVRAFILACPCVHDSAPVTVRMCVWVRVCVYLSMRAVCMCDCPCVYYLLIHV
eukprot:TRINITY_DN6930_c0_g1_i3.p1 TRINITY_DN6930_c0_g1~~TRINITY_DN6930_c0_g1_i3.p1  ORF type:complete len:249 (+),score=4.92 TRINITY_DN6930_c0_g1_i3:1-747(+)